MEKYLLHDIIALKRTYNIGLQRERVDVTVNDHCTYQLDGMKFPRKVLIDEMNVLLFVIHGIENMMELNVYSLRNFMFIRRIVISYELETCVTLYPLETKMFVTTTSGKIIFYNYLENWMSKEMIIENSVLYLDSIFDSQLQLSSYRKESKEWNNLTIDLELKDVDVISSIRHQRKMIYNPKFEILYTFENSPMYTTNDLINSISSGDVSNDSLQLVLRNLKNDKVIDFIDSPFVYIDFMFSKDFRYVVFRCINGSVFILDNNTMHFQVIDNVDAYNIKSIDKESFYYIDRDNNYQVLEYHIK